MLGDPHKKLDVTDFDAYEYAPPRAGLRLRPAKPGATRGEELRGRARPGREGSGYRSRLRVGLPGRGPLPRRPETHRRRQAALPDGDQREVPPPGQGRGAPRAGP